MSMPKTEQRLASTAEVARRLGTDRKGVRRLMARGDLSPVQKLPGRTGAYVFDADVVEQLATERAS